MGDWIMVHIEVYRARTNDLLYSGSSNHYAKEAIKLIKDNNRIKYKNITLIIEQRRNFVERKKHYNAPPEFALIALDWLFLI